MLSYHLRVRIEEQSNKSLIITDLLHQKPLFRHPSRCNFIYEKLVVVPDAATIVFTLNARKVNIFR